MEIIRNGMEMFECQNQEVFKALLKRCIAKQIITEAQAFNFWRECGY